MPFLHRLPVTPNQITVASLLVGLTAGVLLAVGTWVTALLASVLVQLAFVLDCADGQLARYSGTASERGAWLDGAADVLKSFAILLGLTFWAVQKAPHMWFWGFSAYFVHAAGMHLYAIRPQRLARTTPESQSAPATRIEGLYQRLRGVLPFASASAPDQLLLISILAAAGRPRLLLYILTVWGASALAFSLVRTWQRF